MVRHSRRTSDASIPVPSGRCNKLQDVEEKGDHIHVQGEGCKDVLLRTDHKFVCTPHHQLGVKHQVLQRKLRRLHPSHLYQDMIVTTKTFLTYSSRNICKFKRECRLVTTDKPEENSACTSHKDMPFSYEYNGCCAYLRQGVSSLREPYGKDN